MERGGARARENRRLRQAPSRSSGVGFLRARGRMNEASQPKPGLRAASGEDQQGGRARWTFMMENYTSVQ